MDVSAITEFLSSDVALPILQIGGALWLLVGIRLALVWIRAMFF